MDALNERGDPDRGRGMKFHQSPGLWIIDLSEISDPAFAEGTGESAQFGTRAV